ncbi:glycosyltransferase 87 family protein [Microbacterium koreense]|uniref:Glycosyltransferase 87 family protein n=1 Tax=Microbacterium koreense TaxID=323761 RepID=A0ABW2ZTM9_9MICO
MTRRAWLWGVFLVVHVLVAVAGFVMPNQPMGDTYLVYEPWALQAVGGQGIPGVTQPWIYPAVALVPLVVALGLAGPLGYEIAWAVLVTAIDALVFALLVARGRSRARVRAAWYWLAFVLALGPVGIYRLDAITAPLAVAACLWLIGRPVVASVLLTAATWIKVWPAALLAAAFLAMRRRWTLAVTAVATSAVIVGVATLAGGWTHVFGFVSEQTSRGLQIEAPVSSFYLWQAVAGVEGSFVYYDRDVLTYQVAGPSVDVVIAVMTPLLGIVMAAVLVLGAVKAARGASFVRLFPPLALSLVLTLIVVNKVGSPQYLTWLIAPLVFALVIDRSRWRTFAGWALATALLTQVVYPLSYLEVLMVDSFAVAVLTLRNGMLVALLVWAVVRVVAVPTRPGAGIRLSSKRSPSHRRSS